MRGEEREGVRGEEGKREERRKEGVRGKGRRERREGFNTLTVFVCIHLFITRSLSHVNVLPFLSLSIPLSLSLSLSLFLSLSLSPPLSLSTGLEVLDCLIELDVCENLISKHAGLKPLLNLHHLSIVSIPSLYNMYIHIDLLIITVH